MKGYRRIGLMTLSAALLALAGWIARPFFRAAPGPETEITLVCVATGEVFVLDVENIPMYPAPHPQTGAFTLLPVSREPDGRLRVGERYREALVGQLAEVNQVVDVETLFVKSGS